MTILLPSNLDFLTTEMMYYRCFCQEYEGIFSNYLVTRNFKICTKFSNTGGGGDMAPTFFTTMSKHKLKRKNQIQQANPTGGQNLTLCLY